MKMTSNYMKQVERVEDRFKWENYLTNRDILAKAKLLHLAHHKEQHRHHSPKPHLLHHHSHHHSHHHHHHHYPTRKYSNDDIGDVFEKFAFAKHINRLSYTYGKFHPDVNDSDVEEAIDVENYLLPRDLARKYFSYEC